jgi:hypothetical protein
MARLYDAIEPEVISMDMLQRAVEVLRADGDNLIPKADKLDYSEVTAIRLDFRSKIDAEHCLPRASTLFFRHSSHGESLAVE